MIDHGKARDHIEFLQLLKLTGDFYGEPFVLLPWQVDFVENVYGNVDENGKRIYKYGYLEVPKKNGKALALDTQIPTPDGWTTMGEIRIGDRVFGADGKPCRVTFATDVMVGHKCYDVLFSDGSVIRADAEHNWLTNAWIDAPGGKTGGKMREKGRKGESRYGGSIARIRTTEQIRQTLMAGCAHNHSINVAAALQTESADLPIPPYTLGAWLGDGTSASAMIVCCDTDAEILDSIRAEGVPLSTHNEVRRTRTYGLSDGVKDRTKDCVQKQLKGMGLIRNKHIPGAYLRASVDQRMELLRGLMDTDGYCSKAGQCEYTTVSKELANGVYELIVSLGYKATVRVKRATIRGKDCGEKYRIQFWAYSGCPCFRLKRKASRLKEHAGNTRSGVRHIVDVRECESVPVRCIQVDSEDHLYLAGRSMIPTHNTELIAGLALDHVLNDPPSGQIYCCAAEREQASLVYLAAKQKIEQDEYLENVLNVVDSKKEIHNTETGTFIKVLSAEAYSKHGLNPTVVIFDELHALQKRDLWDTMTFGSGAAREEQLILIITTAGDDPDRKTVGWEQHEYARKVRDGELTDPTWYVKIYGAPEDADIYDEKLWYEVNPSLGVTINIENVRQEALKARNSEAAERLFRWLRLNQWVALKRIGWLPITLWDDTAAAWTRSDLLGRRCYVGIDLSSRIDLTADAVLFPPERSGEEWKFFIDVWIPEENIKERVNRDHVPFDRWVKDGLVKATPGNVVDYAYIKNHLERLELDYKVQYYCGDPWHLEVLRQTMSREIQRKVIEIGQTMAGMSPAMSELERIFRKREISHEKSAVGRWSFGNVIIATDGNENIKPMKNKSFERIDPIVALINAMAGAIRLEKKRSVYEERGIRVV